MSFMRAEYHDVTHQAIINFQFLEEVIKMYIERAYWLIKYRLGGELAVSLSRDDIESFALGKLIGEFQKFNANTSLILKMKDLVQYRNICAHQAFLLRHDEQISGERLALMKKIAGDSNRCVMAVGEEVKNIDKIVAPLGWSN